MSFLGHLRIGSCWRGGRWVGAMELEVLPLTFVDFKDGEKWRLVQARDTVLMGNAVHGIPWREGTTWLVEIDFGRTKKLLIPCLEFFTRYYGRNSESARVIATYPWDTVLERFFYDFPMEPDDQRVCLKNWVSSVEAVFLWHLLYDPHTQKACRSIYSELEVQFGSAASSNKAQLKVGPWFEGSAMLTGAGKWLDDNTFLCLDLTGVSEPKGPPVKIERSSFATDGTLDGGWCREHRIKQLPEDQRVSLTDVEPPDVDSEKLRVPNPEIILLGERRRIIKSRRTHAGVRGRTIPSSTDHPLHAPGEGQGTDKGVGSVVFYTEHKWERQGDLKDIWEACGRMADKYPLITSVQWFTFKRGYQQIGPPELELLRPMEDTNVSPKVRNWAYLDVREKVLRGLLIIRIRADSRSFFLIESQRRPRFVSEKKSDDAKGHQGLLLEINASRTDTEQALREVCSSIRYVEGQVKNMRLEAGFPKTTFNHSPRARGDFLFEGVLIGKFAELNLTLQSEPVG
ncbi:hypothetical protein BVK86_11125 [Pseudomonas reinekei]|uniref:Uncharacterized protein n=1 Tax=Pseudomonas reinekei TaxID=395598 RepID=A0A1Q9WYJ4_PSERE|nr:hypothetical protein F7R15_11215 [Pseudomonas reinekei]OLU03860.1 hypothetical protein BVK86_11125 [Pseudomonas reinekei]